MRISSLETRKLHLGKPEVRLLLSFIKSVRKKKFYFFSVLLLIGASIYSLYISRQVYQSKLQLFINTAQATKIITSGSDDLTETIRQNASLRRLNQIVFSEEMVDYLEKEFDLMNHYEITPSDYSKPNLINRLNKNIHIATNASDIITITVSDKSSNELAANMANAIGKKSAELNRKWYMRQIEQLMEVNNSILVELKSEIDTQKVFLQNYFEKLQSLEQSKSDDKIPEKREAYMNITNVARDIDHNMTEFEEAFRKNGFTLKTSTERNFNEMMILQKALKEAKSPYYSPFLFWPILLLLSLILTTTIFYFVFVLEKYSYLLKYS